MRHAFQFIYFAKAKSIGPSIYYFLFVIIGVVRFPSSLLDDADDDDDDYDVVDGCCCRDWFRNNFTLAKIARNLFTRGITIG